MQKKQHIKLFESFLAECDCKQGADMIKREVESIEEEKKPKSEFRKITVIARDHEGNLEKLLKAIQEIGNTGHGFDIVLDPGDENEQKIYWDGDGSDHIKEIESEDHSDEEGGEEDSENDDNDYDHIDDEDNDDQPEEETEDEGMTYEAKKTNDKKVKMTSKNADFTADNDEDREKDYSRISDKSLNEKKRSGSEADGSFPITNLASLKKAIHAYGRSKNKTKTKAHIKSKVKELGLSKHVSDEWK